MEKEKNKKIKKAKKPASGFDILYRVITAVLAAAVFPAAYFGKMVLINFDHETLSQLLALFTSEEAETTGTYLEMSLYEMPSTISEYSSILGGGGYDIKSFLQNDNFTGLIVAAAFFIVALILALVIIGFAAFSSKPKTVAALSAGGILSMIASYVAFNSFFVSPIVSGEVSLASLLNVDGAIAQFALGLIEVSGIYLRNAFYIPAFLLLGILVWSTAVIVVNMGDAAEKEPKKPKKPKKAKAEKK